MADIINEVQTLRNFIGDKLPATTKYHLMRVPNEYKSGELSLDLADGRAESETAYHYRLDRVYQFVYFGADSRDCVRQMQALQASFNNAQSIKLEGSTRHLSVGSFSFGRAFKTETTGVFACIGMLEASVREARSQQKHPKINEVNVNEGGRINGD